MQSSRFVGERFSILVLFAATCAILLDQPIILAKGMQFLQNSTTNFSRNPFRLGNQRTSLIIIRKGSDEELAESTADISTDDNTGISTEASTGSNTPSKENSLQQGDDTFEDLQEEGRSKRQAESTAYSIQIGSEFLCVDQGDVFSSEMPCMFEIIDLGEANSKNERSSPSSFVPSFLKRRRTQMTADVPSEEIEKLRSDTTRAEILRTNEFYFDLQRKKTRIVIKFKDTCYNGSAMVPCSSDSVDALIGGYDPSVIFKLKCATCQKSGDEDSDSQSEAQKSEKKKKKKAKAEDLTEEQKIERKYGKPKKKVRKLIESLKKEMKKKKSKWKWPNWKGISIPSLC